MDPKDFIITPTSASTIDTGFVSSITLDGASYATRALIEAEWLNNFVAVLGEGLGNNMPPPKPLDQFTELVSPFQAHVQITDMQFVEDGLVMDQSGVISPQPGIQFTIRVTNFGLSQLRVIREIGIYPTGTFAWGTPVPPLFAVSWLMRDDINNVLTAPAISGMNDVIEFTIVAGITTHIQSAIELSVSSLGWVTESRLQLHERKHIEEQPGGVHGLRVDDSGTLQYVRDDTWHSILGAGASMPSEFLFEMVAESDGIFRARII